MKFTFEVGKKEISRLQFSRSWLTGRATLTVNGEPITLKSPWDPSTHFTFQLVKRYECTVGLREMHDIVIEHERPQLFAGFRRHKYRVYVDGTLVGEHYGF